MSKHWCPDEMAVEAVVEMIVPVIAATPLTRAPLPSGAKAGLLLVAVACAGVVLGLNQMFARPDVVADEAAAVGELVVSAVTR